MKPEPPFSESELYLAVQTYHQIFQKYREYDSISKVRKICVKDYSKRFQEDSADNEDPIRLSFLTDFLPKYHFPKTYEEVLGKDFIYSAVAYYTYLTSNLSYQKIVKKRYGEQSFEIFKDILESFFNRYIRDNTETPCKIHHVIQTVHYLHQAFHRIQLVKCPYSALSHLITQNRNYLSKNMPITFKLIESKFQGFSSRRWKKLIENLEVPEKNALDWAWDAKKGSSFEKASLLFDRRILRQAQLIRMPKLNILSQWGSQRNLLKSFNDSPKKTISARLQKNRLSPEDIKQVIDDLRQFSIQLFEVVKAFRNHGELYTLRVTETQPETDEIIQEHKFRLALNSYSESAEYQKEERKIVLPEGLSPEDKKLALLEILNETNLFSCIDHQSLRTKIEINKDCLQQVLDFSRKLQDYFIKGVFFARNGARRSIFFKNCLDIIEGLYYDQNYFLLQPSLIIVNESVAISRLNTIKEDLNKRVKHNNKLYDIILNLFSIESKFTGYRSEIKSKETAIPYIGLFLGDIDRSQNAKTEEFNNLIQGFKDDQNTFSYLNHPKKEPMKAQSGILDEINGKHRLRFSKENPSSWLDPEKIWEISYLIQPREKLDLKNLNFFDHLQFIGVFKESLEAVAHDMNRKTALLYSALCEDQMESPSPTCDLIPKLKTLRLFYQGMSAFFCDTLKTAEKSGMLDYCLENLLNLSKTLLDMKNHFAFSALWESLRLYELKIINDEEWKPIYSQIIQRYNQRHMPPKKISKGASGLPFPFFVSQFPIKHPKASDIDIDLFKSFSCCWSSYMKSHGSKSDNVFYSELKTNILNEINEKIKEIRVKRVAKTPLARARSSSLKPLDRRIRWIKSDKGISKSEEFRMIPKQCQNLVFSKEKAPVIKRSQMT